MQGYNDGFFAAIKFILWFILAYILYKVLSSVFYYWTHISSPGNIKSIQQEQLISLESKWGGKSHLTLGLDTKFSEIPEDQRLLINASVSSVRLAGFMGPFSSGVFDEDNATRLALSSGARTLILEIDYVNDIQTPVLVYRDGWGMKQSLNTGSINKVAKSIAARAFNAQNDGVPANLANDPLFVIVYFVRTPSQSDTKSYLRYLGKVAEELQPIKDHLIAQTPQGDYRRQALESQLFFTNYIAFKKKIILMTNVDTSGFRNLQNNGLAGELGANQDLDFMTNVRIYGRESPSPFGSTGSPMNSSKSAAVITTPTYWLMTPSDRAASAVNSTKETWTVVMHPVPSTTNNITQDILTKLYTTYGVHSIPKTLFSQELDKTSGWTVKPELLRYKPPSPITVQIPYTKSDSGGGTVVAPKI